MLGDPPGGGRLRQMGVAGFFELQETTTRKGSKINQRHMSEG